MAIHLPLFKDTTALPTGKNHVSFSETSTFFECGWKHKLKYVDGLQDFGSEHTVFGSVVHENFQNWLLNKDSVWLDSEENAENCATAVKKAFEEIAFNAGSEEKLNSDWLEPAKAMAMELPGWMDATFGAWKLVAAELELFEPIEGKENKWFKGFVDCVLRVPKRTVKGGARQYTYWIIDWKTTSWGWDRKKKMDPAKRMQLILYKHFVAKKLDIDPKSVKCGFVLLKRTAKSDSRFELIEVSAGEKVTKKAIEDISFALDSIGKKFWSKSRGEACRYCEFFATKHCTWENK
jgi:hypothetical protein